ncbi:MAG: TIGR04150 pseudo-rSAM protein [Bacteroidales bacterium]|nr:TIGR04150 pseudo-rSAM protein [Bacteroidales bacterium]MBQ8959503.1 TIGR04150 pseudo-rSAM protein [Bacteroidales bacterium]
MKDGWLSLPKTVYISFEEPDSVLLYHTEKSCHAYSRLPKNVKLMEDVYNPKNLGVVNLNEYLPDGDIEAFLDRLLESGMCKLKEQTKDAPKPISFLPILNLQNDVERLQEIGEDHMIGDNISTYLTRTVIHLNSKCGKHCPHCGLFHKQTLCCTATEPPQVMPVERLKELVGQLATTSVQVIDLVGGDLRTYPHLSQLHALVEQYPQFSWHLWQHIINGKGLSLDHVKTEVILTAPFEKTMLPETFQHDSNVWFHLLVESEMQVEQAEQLIAGIEAERCEWVPVFNGENLKFFEDNVFLNEDDIMSGPVSMREIFCHQKLNTNYFGKLHFFADGEVKADVNKEAVGRFPEKNVLELVYEELTRNTAWRRIREGARCSGCRFRYLCPSSGNYETVIGKESLCHVQPMRE